MHTNNIRALTFDTGGTILDWHTGFETALADAGARHGAERNWHDIANQLRRTSLAKMLNLGEHEPPGYNFDGAHRSTGRIIGSRARCPPRTPPSSSERDEGTC